MLLCEVANVGEITKLHRGLITILQPYNVKPVFTFHFEGRLLGREEKITPKKILIIMEKFCAKHVQNALQMVQIDGRLTCTIKQPETRINLVVELVEKQNKQLEMNFITMLTANNPNFGNKHTVFMV